MLVTLQHPRRMPEDLVLLQDTEEVDRLLVTTTMVVQLEQVCQQQEHPAYAPYSPARFGGGPAGGTTPGYAGAMGGMSMGYRPNTGQSPGYTAPGPAYSPTQNFHGTPDPAYTGRPQGNNNQPGGSQQPEKK